MPMYNLIEYSNNYSKTCGSLWQYASDEPAVDGNGSVVEIYAATLRELFNFKAKIAGEIGANRGKDSEIMVPLKYLSNFWRTF